VILLWLVSSLLVFAIGVGCGTMWTMRNWPRLLARLSDEQLDELARKTEEARHDGAG
jgi:hypothetical protein